MISLFYWYIRHSLLLWHQSINQWLGFADEDMLEGALPRRLQACSWLVRQIWDRQVQPQRPQTNVLSGSLVEDGLWFFLFCLLSFRLACRVSSKEDTPCWIRWRQASRSAASVDPFVFVCEAGALRFFKGVLVPFLWCPSVAVTR